jgi:hypothetical protein
VGIHIAVLIAISRCLRRKLVGAQIDRTKLVGFEICFYVDVTSDAVMLQHKKLTRA